MTINNWTVARLILSNKLTLFPKSDSLELLPCNLKPSTLTRGWLLPNKRASHPVLRTLYQFPHQKTTLKVWTAPYQT